MESREVADVHGRASIGLDVAIVGGSFAGMAAALQVARANRTALVVDAGIVRNRHARKAHGFLGQDDQPPSSILDQGRRQLLRYPKVKWLRQTVTRVHGSFDDGFSLETDAGRHLCRRLILATGVRDDLPGVDGLDERWGRSVFHCPYCHGYELLGGTIGVLVDRPECLSLARLLTEWGRVTVFPCGSFEPDADQLRQLADNGVGVERRAVLRVVDDCTVVLAGDQRIRLDGLFAVPVTRIANPWPAQLGLALLDGHHGQHIATDARRATSVRGVYACGDVAHSAGNISQAIADGATAGIFAHESLALD